MDEKEVKMLGTKEVAAKLKVDAKLLRQVLRANNKGAANEGSRYQWKPDENLSKLKAQIDDFLKKQAERKKAAAKSAPDPEPEETEEETSADEIFEEEGSRRL